MLDFWPVLVLSTFMVLTSCLLYYEILRLIWAALPRLSITPRLRVLCVVIAIFGGHTLVVWYYGLVYWLMPHLSGLLPIWQGDLANASLGGIHDGSFESALYFSATTYSSLGFGDITPHGHMRLLSSVEVLNGLVLIGWSVSFTYLAMEKFWGLHRK